MAANKPSLGPSGELAMLLTNSKVLEDKMKFTKQELDGLNQRIEAELSRTCYTSFESNLIDILLTQHQQIVQQYNEEIAMLQRLRQRVAEELNKQLNAGNLTVKPDRSGVRVHKNKRINQVHPHHHGHVHGHGHASPSKSKPVAAASHYHSHSNVHPHSQCAATKYVHRDRTKNGKMGTQGHGNQSSVHSHASGSTHSHSKSKSGSHCQGPHAHAQGVNTMNMAMDVDINMDDMHANADENVNFHRVHNNNNGNSNDYGNDSNVSRSHFGGFGQHSNYNHCNGNVHRPDDEKKGL